MDTRKYESPLGGDISLNKANKGKGWKGLKGQAALALAVSLWIGGSGVALAAEVIVQDGESKNYISCSGDGNTIIVESGGSVTGSGGSDAGASITGGVNNNEITVAGTVRYRVNGGYSGDNSVSGNHVTVSGEVKDYVFGGNSNNGSQVSDNHVIVTGKVNECAYGGRVVSGSGSATGNSVTVNGGTVDNRVYGGATDTGSAINNAVTLHNATIGKYVYGGYGSSSCFDKKTGNKLILSGASTAQGVYNFATIELPSTLTWSETSPVLSATSFSNCDTLDITSATALANHTAPGTMTLLASNTANDFANMTLKYSTAAAAVIPATGQVVKSTAKTSTVNGVGLAYNNTHTVTIANSNKSIIYTVANKVNKITLGEIAWSADEAVRNAGVFDGSGYDFGGVGIIDKFDTYYFKFTFANDAAYKSLTNNASITLINNAKNIATFDKGNVYTDFDYTVGNGVKLTTCVDGKLSANGTDRKLTYIVDSPKMDSPKIDIISLAGWDSSKDAFEIPSGWGKPGTSCIGAEGFTAPTINAGQSKDILTTTTDSFFNDNQITGALKYTASAESSDTVSGVTLTGYESKGVKASADGKALVYERSNFNVNNVSFGSMAWGTGRTANGAGYDYTNAAVDLRGLTFSNPQNISAGTTTLLTANSSLGDVTEPTRNISYGYSPVSGLTVNATVNGSVSKSGNDIIYTATANNASKLTFGNVEWKDSGALLDHSTTLSNVSFNGATVDTTNINFTNIKELEANKNMTLVSDFGNSVGTITGTKYKVGSTLQGEGKASLVDSNDDGTMDALIFTTDTRAEKMTVQEQTHNTVMGAEVGMAALSAGNDFVGAATEGLAMAGNTGTDGMATYANMGGGSMNVETGSHVKTHTWNAILALGHKNEKKLSTTEYGAFFEYGTGNYSTFNGAERGDGSTHYTGGGILGKWQKNNGFYVEGSLRAGSIHDDATNVLRDVNGNPYSYDTDATYWGAHIGVGREIKLNKTDILDLYAKYFYNHRGSVSFDAGGHYDLDAVESSVLRIGTRYTVKKNDKVNFYGGLALEHEFCGRAAGTADGVAIRGADISGTSVRGEIGATFQPGDNSPVTLDLNLSGFAGKKRGLTGGLSAVFHF